MSDKAIGFHGIDKICRRLRVPLFHGYRLWQLVESVIDFNRVEMLDVITEPFAFRQSFRIKQPRPMPVVPAGSAYSDVRFAFTHKNHSNNLTGIFPPFFRLVCQNTTYTGKQPQPRAVKIRFDELFCRYYTLVFNSTAYTLYAYTVLARLKTQLMKKQRFFIIAAFCLLPLFCSTGYAQHKKSNQQGLSTQEQQDSYQPPSKAIQQTPAARKQNRTGLTYKKLIQTAVVLVVGYLVIFLLVRIINRRITDIKVKHIVRKNTIYLFSILIIVYIAFVWLQNIGSLTIFLSVIGAGFALALQEPILSVAGWFLILIRRPFYIGDRIELGGVKGDVIDIRLLQTVLLEIGNWVNADQSTGRIASIPNSAVFRSQIFNYSRGFEFIWNEIKILVTFESDWKFAEQILMQHGNKQAEGMEKIVKGKIDDMARRYMIYYDNLTPIVYVDIKNSGVQLTLRYLTQARNRRTTNDRLCRAILQDFEKAQNVNFAYPTYRIVK